MDLGFSRTKHEDHWLVHKAGQYPIHSRLIAMTSYAYIIFGYWFICNSYAPYTLTLRFLWSDILIISFEFLSYWLFLHGICSSNTSHCVQLECRVIIGDVSVGKAYNLFPHLLPGKAYPILTRQNLEEFWKFLNIIF